jgi:hypothetical protein
MGQLEFTRVGHSISVCICANAFEIPIKISIVLIIFIIITSFYNRRILPSEKAKSAIKLFNKGIDINTIIGGI